MYRRTQLTQKRGMEANAAAAQVLFAPSPRYELMRPSGDHACVRMPRSVLAFRAPCTLQVSHPLFGADRDFGLPPCFTGISRTTWTLF